MASSAPKLIGTHSGTFHCDEALGCFMLKQLPEYKDAKIIRSRNPEELAKCDIVIDVGGIYNHDEKRYDHHQRGFEVTFSDEYSTKLSSAGLVYKHYGQNVIRAILEDNNGSDTILDENVDMLYQKIYKSFIEGVDAIDNGKSMYPTDIKPQYEEKTGLSHRVSRLNPWWNQKDVDIHARFEKAMQITGDELVERVKYYAFSWLPARSIVKEAFESRRSKADPSGHIMVLEPYCPWKEGLFELEKQEEREGGKECQVLYIIYQDEAGNWRVQAIPEMPDSFVSRRPLPEAWRGLRDEQLSAEAGIEDCIFVHAAGFIGGNKSKEGAISMAKKALEM